jgi:hypothetical protein
MRNVKIPIMPLLILISPFLIIWCATYILLSIPVWALNGKLLFEDEIKEALK